MDEDGLDYDNDKICKNNMRRFSNSVTPHSDELYNDSYDVESLVMSEPPDLSVMTDENDIDDMPNNDAMMDN